MIRAFAIAALIFAALLAAFVRNCSGARPEVVGQELRPPAREGDPWQADATVRNAGSGEGEVLVDVRMIDRSSGRTYGDARKLDVRPREQVRVSIPLWAPRGDYRLVVKAEYPPR